MESDFEETGVSFVKELFRKWNDISLIKRIVVGLVIGAILGVFFPNVEPLTLLGSLFVSALKAVAPILVFFLVISALANARSEDGRRALRYQHARCRARRRCGKFSVSAYAHAHRCG